MQSQTDELDNFNSTAQINHFEPAVEYQSYDLPTCDLSATTCHLTAASQVETNLADDTTTAAPVVTRKMPARHRFKWTDSEIDQLYREVQLKNYTIQDISAKHQRTNSAILFKLKEEKLIQWDCSLDNTNMRTVLQYYNEYLRGYQAIEEEEEDEEEEDDEDDEDYVPADSSEEDEDDDDEEEEDIYRSIHKDLVRVNKYTPDILDKLTFAYLDAIYFTVLFASNAITYAYRFLFKC